jgi:hypothetical protein
VLELTLTEPPDQYGVPTRHRACWPGAGRGGSAALTVTRHRRPELARIVAQPRVPRPGYATTASARRIYVPPGCLYSQRRRTALPKQRGLQWWKMDKKRQPQKRSHNAPTRSESQEPASSAGQPTAWDSFSTWSRNSRWQRVIFKLVVAILILGMVGAAVPTIGSAIEYVALKANLPGAFERKLPDELTSKSGVRVVERKTTLDLSGWQWTSSRDLESTQKLSRGLSTTSFTLRKTEPGAKYFVHTVSSASKVQPSIWCDSQPFRIVEANGQGASNIRQWNVLVDISKEPDDQPFTVNLVVTFWNAFQKKSDWWGGFRILQSTERATYRIVFPPELPATSVRFRYKDITADNMVDLDGATLNVTPTSSGEPVPALTWTVDNPLPDRSYQVAWTWPDNAAPADQVGR